MRKKRKREKGERENRDRGERDGREMLISIYIPVCACSLKSLEHPYAWNNVIWMFKKETGSCIEETDKEKGYRTQGVQGVIIQCIFILVLRSSIKY